jgi:hypothetical protein
MTRLGENSTGFHRPQEVREPPRPPDSRRAGDDAGRSLSAAWITDELLERTQRVWSRVYGRPIDEREALEILLNVKRFAEVLMKAAKTGKTP